MGLITPVVSGLAIGVAFVLLFAIFSPLIPFDTERRALDDATLTERKVELIATKSDRPWSSTDYVTLSRAELTDHPIILYSIQNAKLKYDSCAITNCFASPVPPSVTFSTKLGESEARELIGKYTFKDISPPGDHPTRSYGLHIYYDGDYYGIAISGVREPKMVWIEHDITCVGARCDVTWLHLSNDSSSKPISIMTSNDGKHVSAGHNFGDLNDTIQFVIEQQEKQGVNIFEFKLVPIKVSNCEWGECPDYYLLKLLVSENDGDKMLDSGYLLSEDSDQVGSL